MPGKADTSSKLLEFRRRDPREIGRRWVRILLEGLLVFVNLLERGRKDPGELACDLNILVGIHDGEHGIRGGVRPDLARPADETTCSDGAFGCFSQLAAEWTRVALIRRPLISQIADDLTFRPVVRGEDQKRVVVDLEVFQRLEDPAHVVVAFHHPFAILVRHGRGADENCNCHKCTAE
jgi:hypothetical protein